MHSAMDHNVSVIERAFQIAKSGGCENVAAVVRALKKEGFSTTQVVGGSLTKQLTRLITEARRTHA